MSRSAIIGLGVLVLAGVAVVYLMVRGDGDATPAADDPAPVATGSARPTGSGPTLPATSGRPQLRPGSGAPASRDTTGFVVTDHRTGEPTSVPAEHVDTRPGRKLPQAVVRSVHAHVSELAAGCARSIPAAARGTEPRLKAEVKVGITGGEMHVTSATATTSGLTGPEADAAAQCLQTALLNYQMPTPDEADLDGYDLQLSFLVR